MERFNFSDQIACGGGTLYLQTHTTEAPWSAESLLYEQGRVVTARRTDLSHMQDVHHLQRAAEAYHMGNCSELERICAAFSASIPHDPAFPVLQTVRLLLQWSLWRRALELLTAGESALMNEIDFWLLKAESLFALKRYAQALEALKKASMLDRGNGRVLLLLAAGLLGAAVEQGAALSPADHARLVEQTATCLSRLAALADERGHAARLAGELLQQGLYEDALDTLRTRISRYPESG